MGKGRTVKVKRADNRTRTPAGIPRKKVTGKSMDVSYWDGSIPIGKTLFLFGKRGTGKSVAHFYLVYKNASKYFFGIAISNVRDSCRMFENCLPYSMVFDNYAKLGEPVIQRILKEQRKYELDPSWEMDKILINVDDCSNKKSSALDTDTIHDLFKTGRHYDLTIILAVQYLMDVKPGIRMNTDIIMVGRESNKQVRKKLFENFFDSVFDDFDTFCRAMNKLTNNYHWMVFNNAGSSNEAKDCLFVFKAKEMKHLPKFRVGDPQFWLLDHMKRIRLDPVNVVAEAEAEVEMAYRSKEDDVKLPTEFKIVGNTGATGITRKTKKKDKDRKTKMSVVSGSARQKRSKKRQEGAVRAPNVRGVFKRMRAAQNEEGAAFNMADLRIDMAKTAFPSVTRLSAVAEEESEEVVEEESEEEEACSRFRSGATRFRRALEKRSKVGTKLPRMGYGDYESLGYA